MLETPFLMTISIQEQTPYYLFLNPIPNRVFLKDSWGVIARYIALFKGCNICLDKLQHVIFFSQQTNR